MADIVVDSLITQLDYEVVNPGVMAQAEAAAKALEKQNKATAVATDKLSADNQKLAEYTDALTLAQVDLTEQLADSANNTDKLKDEQKELTEAIEQAGGATGKQFRRLEDLDTEIKKSARVTAICEKRARGSV